MIEAVSRTARLLKAKDPEFPNTFLMPVQESAEVLLTTARLFAEHAEPLAERFTGHAMSKDFPANFTRLLQRYEEAIEGRERGKGLTTAARKSIEEAIAAGLAAARRLDIIVGQELASDTVAVAEWTRNRRIGYRVGKKRPEEPVAAPVAASPDASATTPPIDLDVGDVSDIVDFSSVAAPIVVAEAEGEEAA